MHDLLGLTADEMMRLAAGLPGGPVMAGRIYGRLFRSGCFEPDAFGLAEASVAAWRERFTASTLTVEKVLEEPGEFAATTKAVLVTHDGHRLECVRIPMRVEPATPPPSHDGDEKDALLTESALCRETSNVDTPMTGHLRRTSNVSYTLCLSSQIGCRMGCAFCETGGMGLVRNLDAAEIVAEVMTARHVLGWSCRNLVFMGMGEPLDNADHLIQALTVLTDQRGLHYSHERITVCTAGHADGLARLKALGWKRLNLSISLNATTDEQRNRLMPVNRNTDLATLGRILADYPQRRNFTLGVNYCLMPGFNDTRDDAVRIAGFCKPLGRVLVNLIPYNPGSAALTRAPDEDEVVRFVDWLRDAGVAVRRRITKGRSIMAGCGQLGNAHRRRRTPPTPEPS
jgi:23S rRNA (adenine2503-C2)-methyltransferase